jgi:hypothetical protein
VAARVADNMPAMMSGGVTTTEAPAETEIATLPWHLPVEDWPTGNLAATAGTTRNMVRFVHVDGAVIAIKETSERVAGHEYGILRKLARLGIPCVEPVAVITGRATLNGEPLKPALVTRPLDSFKPYRALFSQTLGKDTLTWLIEAQALLMVRLHLIGFYWGEASLSNTLFNPDTKAAPACLMHAESGTLQAEISALQREYDVQIARINMAAELVDLLGDGSIEDDLDPIATSELIVHSYTRLWVTATNMNQAASSMQHCQTSSS